MIQLQITPESDRCAQILNKKEFVLIGISPFNGYFTLDNIKNTIICGLNNFKEIGLLIPDVIVLHTLKGFGCDIAKAEKQAKKQMRYLENKIDKAIDELSVNYDVSCISKVFWSEYQNNPEYLKLYDITMNEFENNPYFRENCIKICQNVIENNNQKHLTSNPDFLEATQYLLKKFPFYWDAPSICGKESIVYIYHLHPEFLKEIYQNRSKYNLLSENQALCTIHP